MVHLAPRTAPHTPEQHSRQKRQQMTTTNETATSTTEKFRARAEKWLKDNATPSSGQPSDAVPASTEVAKAFLKSMHEAGFSGITWPTEYGGQGFGPDELAAWNEAASGYALPLDLFMVGLGMPGPTILELGTEEQKSRFLPKLLAGEEVWCQLFSEPGAGSDVAALTSSATAKDGGWVLNGQKVWTSEAHRSDFGVVLARTDPSVPKHQGITMFIVDMHDPGVTVRPLVIPTGEAPFNEVFLDDVYVSPESVIGEVGKGWQAAVTMLRHERVALGTRAAKKHSPLGYETLAAAATRHGRLDDPSNRRKLAELYARESSLSALTAVIQAEAEDGKEVGPLGSVAKLAKAEYGLWASDIAQEVLGDVLLRGEESVSAIVAELEWSIGRATAGGTNEIQRNIIAERILGLPKDPGVQKNVPFNQTKKSN